MKKMKDQQHMDWLNNLPDAIIHHILTLMDTKYAVQTCVLSKRWSHLWTHLPSLYFNSWSFNRKASFENFVFHVLSCHKASNLCSFILKIRRLKVDQIFIDRVINYAVSHHVQHLHISSTYYSDFHLTPCLLTCQSLRSLKLEYRGRNSITNLLNSLVFQMLTTLDLNDVYLNNENVCIDPFSSCFNLENLLLTQCHVTCSDAFNLSAPQLVNLTISYLKFDGEEKKVIVCAPRLISFNFRANCSLGLSVELDSCPYLDRVNIDVDDYLVEVSNDQNRKREYIFGLINIFHQLSHAKSLTLSFQTIKALSMVPGLLENQRSPFNNLKTLKVNARQIMKSFINYHTSSCDDLLAR